MKRYILITLLTALVTGCGGISWVKSDNTSANPQAIKSAKVSCNIANKYEKFNNTRRVKSALLNFVDDKTKQEIKNDLVTLEKKVDDEIEVCMKKQGFIKGK